MRRTAHRAAEQRPGGGGRADGVHRAGRRPYGHPAAARAPARDPAGRGQVALQGRAIAEHGVTVAIVDAALSPVQQRNLERAWNCKVIDRTGLILDIFGERAATQGGRAAGRTGASGLPAVPPGAVLDPPRAAARRLRLPGRPRRDADRGRPPPDRRAHRAAEEGTGAGAPHPRPASLRAAARAVSGGRAGRLHQCRQVHAVQCADRRRRWPRATSCSPRSIPRCAGCACRPGGAPSCPTPSASSASCRMSWSRRSAPRSRRWRRPT